MNKYTLDDISQIMNLIFTSAEAANYLGITKQRLNQLVKAKILLPVKTTKAGNLFYKAQLDERKNDVMNIGKNIEKSTSIKKLNTPFINEVLTYYTIHPFYNNSDKKTVPVFEELSNEIDVRDNFINIQSDISKLLDIDNNELRYVYQNVFSAFQHLELDDFIIKKGMPEYPMLLAKTNEAPPYLFMRGNISLLNERIVSIVGSRQATKKACDTAAYLANQFGKINVIVASGLARGIDTAAQSECIKKGFKTISVIGTPITQVYPRENEDLQRQIADKGLVLSQFAPSTKVQRWHFPMRNAVMSGISLATIIVEAGETSGSLKQADYALKQGRIVFIPQSAFDNSNITWPKRYLAKRGAFKFKEIKDIFKILLEYDIVRTKEPKESPIESMNLFGDDENALS